MSVVSDMAKIVVDDATFEEWKQRVVILDKEIAERDGERTRLKHFIEFCEGIQDWGRGRLKQAESFVSGAPESEVESDPDLTLTDAVIAVLKKYRTAMKPAQIKEHIAEVGFSQPYATAYLYTAIIRAAEKGLILRRRDKRYAFNPAGRMNGMAGAPIR